MYELLRKAPLFAGLSDSDFEHLCQGVEELRLPAGEVLFAEGSPSTRAYVVTEGSLEIYKTSSGREVLLGVHEPGAMIGETALLEGTPLTESVRARTDSVLLAMRKEQVDRLRSTSPSTEFGTPTVDLMRMRDDVALSESGMWFRTLAESAKDAIISADSNGDIVFWSKGAQSIFGYEQEEVLGRGLSMLIPERYREAHRRGLERFNVTGERHVIGTTVELHGLRKDGNEFPLELSLADWKTSKGIFFSGIIRDITGRKRAEDALADMASFPEMNPGPVLKLDRHGTILLVNAAARELLGEQDMLGKSWYALCPGLEPIALKRLL